MPHYGIVHFACHAHADLDQPLRSGLMMAGEEEISLSDFMAQRLADTRLVVLSACETGVPGTTLPDEAIGLPAGLLQAGVASVIASLWAVSDDSTMLLMVRFYDLWRNHGLKPVEALSRAQQWLRDSTNEEKARELLPLGIAFTPVGHESKRGDRDRRRDHAHPHHWAAFTYVGA
jgi:CHAT domain-containing protein